MGDLLHIAVRYAAILTVAIAAALAAPPPATAQGVLDHHIVRIVNDAPISSYDVAARLRLVEITSRGNLSGAALEQVREQVVETLVDEQLELQEAKRLGLTVSDQEIQSAIRRIEQQNRMAEGQLFKLLSQRNVDANTLVAQIRATLAWRKVVTQRVRTKVSIGEEDIDAYLASLQEKGGTEYLLGEIFIAANDPDDLPRAQETANQLIQEMRRGTPFAEMARQFSQAPTASSGGDTGWVRESQLEPRLLSAIKELQAGQMTPPIGVGDGYYIIALRSVRKFGAEGQQQTLYDLRRLFVPLSANASEQQVRSALIRATRVHDSARDCASFERAAAAAGEEKPQEPGEIPLSDLPPGLQPIVSKLQVGQKTQVYRLSDGALVMMLCGKRTHALGLPSRDEVRENLLQQQADVVARRYLSELRQDAIIQTIEERS